MTIRSTTADDVSWIVQVLTNFWGSPKIVTRGKLIDASSFPGFIAWEGERRAGLIVYVIGDAVCEIISLNALIPGKGIGTALLEKVEEEARKNNCKKLIVCTTNDNQKAVEFYVKKGFRIAAVRKNIMEEYRKLKPEIPEIGNDGILLTDEIELEKNLI